MKTTFVRMLTSFIFSVPQSANRKDLKKNPEFGQESQEPKDDLKPEMILKYDDKKFPQLFRIHREVLESSSRVFQRMLSPEWTSGSNKSVPDPEVIELNTEIIPPEIVNDLVSFFKTGSVRMTSQNVLPLCVASDFLDISNLFSGCQKFLIKLLNSSNVQNYYQFSIEYPLEELREECLKSEPEIQNFHHDEEHCEVGDSKFPLSKSPSTKLFCFGGLNENSTTLSAISYLDLSTGSWETLPSRTSCRGSISATVLEDKIYLRGDSPEVEVFDCSTNTWSELPALPVQASGCSIASLNGELYVSGGEVQQEENQEKEPTSGVYRFSPEVNAWEHIGSMQKPRSYHRMFTLNDRLYAIGGELDIRDTWRKNVLESNTLEVYDPGSDQWSVVSQTLLEHYSNVSVAVDEQTGSVYLSSNDGFEVWKQQENRWRVLNRLAGHYNNDLVFTDKRLLSLGGRVLGGGGTTDVFEYEPEVDEWKALPEVEMNVARYTHCSVLVYC